MVTGISNAYDHMELCLIIQAEVILNEIGFYITEINFTAEHLGSNFLLPTFSKGGIWDFQVAYLLLDTVNLKLCVWVLSLEQAIKMEWAVVTLMPFARL